MWTDYNVVGDIMKSVMVCASVASKERAARAWALRVGLLYRDNDTLSCDYLIVFEENRIGIATPSLPRTNTFYLDFTSGSLAFRAKSASKQNELLAKAVGLKGRPTLRVLDATAGLGRDAYILATLGAHVTLIERSPILALLLQDAMSHISEREVQNRLQFVQSDAITWLTQQSNSGSFPYDVICLDPMFPERVKSAAVKKEMLILRDLVGQDLDADALFAAAFACPVSRIVVKRPIHAPMLGAKCEPTFSLKGRANRFDVYIKPPFSSVKS